MTTIKSTEKKEVIYEALTKVEEENTILAEKAKEAEELASKKEEEMQSLKNEFSQLKEMFMAVLGNGGNNQPQAVTSDENIMVRSCMLKEASVFVNGREIDITCNESTPLSKEDVKHMIQNKRYRPFFAKGLFYFEEEEWYEYFRINKINPITEERVDEIMSGEVPAMLAEFDKFTDYKKSFAFYNTLMFKVAKLMSSGKASPETMMHFSDADNYFGKHLSLAMQQVEWL